MTRFLRSLCINQLHFICMRPLLSYEAADTDERHFLCLRRPPPLCHPRASGGGGGSVWCPWSVPTGGGTAGWRPLMLQPWPPWLPSCTISDGIAQTAVLQLYYFVNFLRRRKILTEALRLKATAFCMNHSHSISVINCLSVYGDPTHFTCVIVEVIALDEVAIRIIDLKFRYGSWNLYTIQGIVGEINCCYCIGVFAYTSLSQGPARSVCPELTRIQLEDEYMS